MPLTLHLACVGSGPGNQQPVHMAETVIDDVCCRHELEDLEFVSKFRTKFPSLGLARVSEAFWVVSTLVFDLVRWHCILWSSQKGPACRAHVWKLHSDLKQKISILTQFLPSHGPPASQRESSVYWKASPRAPTKTKHAEAAELYYTITYTYTYALTHTRHVSWK